MDGEENVLQETLYDMSDDGNTYLPYGNRPSYYEAFGFPETPTFCYSISDGNGDHLDQNELGYPNGCAPVSVAMAMTLAGAKDFNYTEYLARVSKHYDIKDDGMRPEDAIRELSNFYGSAPVKIYTKYNPYTYMKELLRGNPILITIRNTVDYNQNHYMTPWYDAQAGLHFMVLSGFFLCDERLGFEVYDPSAPKDMGERLLVWESDLWGMVKGIAPSLDFRAFALKLKK